MVVVIAAIASSGCKDFTVAQDRSDLRALSRDVDIVRIRGISDADVDELRRFERLRVITLCGGWGKQEMLLTAAGMARLAEVVAPTLEIVTVCDSVRLDDAFLVALASIKTVHDLTLRGCPGFSEAGLAAIAELPAITYLDVRGCPQIDDEWLPILSMHSELSYLGLAGTSVSAGGVSRLQALLPGCKIDTDENVWRYMERSYRSR